MMLYLDLKLFSTFVKVWGMLNKHGSLACNFCLNQAFSFW